MQRGGLDFHETKDELDSLLMQRGDGTNNNGDDNGRQACVCAVLRCITRLFWSNA